MPYSVDREKKSFFSRYSNEFRIEFEPMTWVLLDFRRMEMFSLQSHQIKKTGWWEGNCLIYEYIYFGLRIVITKTKKRVLCVTLARTHALENTHLFQFFQSSSTFSSFRLLLLIVADSIPVSSSIFGILMVHFSRNAYFSMQSHSLVREPFSDLHWRNKREKKTSSHKKWNWKSTKK